MNKWWLIGCGGCLGLTLVIALVCGGVAWFGMDALNKSSEKSNQAIFGGPAPAGYVGMSFDTKAKPAGEGDEAGQTNSTPDEIPTDPGLGAVGIYMNVVEKTMLVAMEGNIGNAEIATLATADEAALKPLLEQMMQSSQSENANNRIKSVRQASITLNGQPYPAFEAETENRAGQLMPLVATVVTHPNQENQILLLMHLEKSIDTIDPAVYTKLREEMTEIIANTKLHEQALTKADLAKLTPKDASVE